MATKTQVEQLERKENQEARSTAHRTGNYQSKAFKTGEVCLERPYNCYGCNWERLPNNKGFRLKFAHKLCYAQHEEVEEHA
jgi:hypothetical protein